MSRYTPAILIDKIEEWTNEGLISPEQAQEIRQREAADTTVTVTVTGRVKLDEILVYLGSLVIFMALAFLVVANWQILGDVGRILVVLAPTAAMLGAGRWLLEMGPVEPRFRRGAQALWLGGTLLCGLSAVVIFDALGWIDWHMKGPGDPFFVLSCVLVTAVAGLLFLWLPTVTQSVALHIGGTAVMFSFMGWLDQTQPILNPFYTNLRFLGIGLVVGGLWLALSEWLVGKGAQRGIVRVSRLFGALIILGSTMIAAVEYYPFTWQKIILEVLAFAACVSFIIASVKLQTRTFLYCGAAFLLLLIIYLNFEHFADTIGLPITLFITGVILIGLGLGTGRLYRTIQIG
ncbi:MAG: DUF2157 domain-containing protein [Chloroflexi bacterium]|nr:DUF2157 domain-containing protein [Chloroflexota bacterium]